MEEKGHFELLRIDAWAYDDGWTWNDIQVLTSVDLADDEVYEYLMQQVDDPNEWYIEAYDFGFTLVRKSNDEPVLSLREIA